MAGRFPSQGGREEVREKRKKNNEESTRVQSTSVKFQSRASGVRRKKQVVGIVVVVSRQYLEVGKVAEVCKVYSRVTQASPPSNKKKSGEGAGPITRRAGEVWDY